MTEDKSTVVVEGNKTIARFTGRYKFDYLTITDCPPERLKYHSSWDWLMPVVENIESLGHDTNIYHDEDGQQMIIFKTGFSYQRKAGDVIIPNRLSGEKSKIKAVWLAVVDFIKWHNQYINQKA